MKGKRSSEEQIIGALKEAERGVPPKDICRRLGVSLATFFRWKAKFGGMEVSDARRLRHLEEENRRLKHIVADLTLDNQVLRSVAGKKW